MNKTEQVKAEKNGRDVGPDIERFAREGWEIIPEGDVQRLKWHGVFLRDPTPGYFMMRIRITNGMAMAPQLRTLADISRRHGGAILDITTRQQIQLRWLTIQRVPGIQEALQGVGLTTLQTEPTTSRPSTASPPARSWPTSASPPRTLRMRSPAAWRRRASGIFTRDSSPPASRR